MTQALEDHQHHLTRMREEGVRCLTAAASKQDHKGLMQWQRVVEKVDTLIVGQLGRDEACPPP